MVEEGAQQDALTLAVLGPGETFGEHTVLAGAANFTVRASSDLVVLRLGESEFAALLAAEPAFQQVLQARVQDSIELSFLRRLSILSHLKLPDLKRLAAQLERVELEADQQLFAEGSEGHTAYIVRQGRIRILKDFNGRSRQIAVAKPGDLFGEMALLCGTPRVAAAVAATRTVLLALSRQAFEKVTSDEDRAAAMMQEATDKLLQLVAIRRDTGPDRSIRPRLSARWVKADRGWWSRAYPLVSTDEPVLSGLACLAMAETFHGKSGVPQADVDRRVTSETPETMESLSRVAEELGYLTRLARLAPEQLPELTLPAIIESNPGVFELLYEATARRVVVAGPANGLRAIARAAFDANWDGRVLCLSHLPHPVFGNQDAGSVIRQFLPFARPHMRPLAWMALIALLAQLSGLAAPLFRQTIIDKVLVTFDFRLLRLVLLGMLLVTGFQMAAGALREYLTAQIMRRMTSAVQLRFFNHILRLPMAALGRWQVGDFTVRLSENEHLLRLISETGFSAVISSFTVVVNIVMLFALSGQMAPVAVAFVIAYTALMYFSSPRLRAADNAVFEGRKATEAHFIEAIGGIQTIKSLALERQSFQTGFGLVRQLKNDEVRSASVAFHVGQIATLLSQAATIVVLGWGASLALEGKITTGELVAFQSLLGTTLAPLGSLVDVWDQLQEICVSFERTAEVLQVPQETNPVNAAVHPLRGEVALENVTFRYSKDGEPVLRGVSLAVQPGQKIALVGRSGSGKTTLAGLLLSLYEPESGRILVDQVDMMNLHKGALRRQVGFVEQHPYLFSGTIRENIAKADPSAGLETIVSAATLAGAHGFIQDLPLAYDTPIGERGTSLSGGQRQRIVIARALLNNPSMLVLDEATSALDSESEQAIQRNLDGIMAGKTTFVIAHRLSTVRNADKIVVLDEGRIVEEGTHDDLMAQRGLYHYLATAS